MRTKHNFRKKKILALCLSVLMLGSTVVGLASCKDGETSSSTSDVTESTKKTTGLLTNADFETDKFKDDTPIVTSTTGWTRSVNSATSGSALSSKAASGIIDTSTEAWKNLTESKVSGAAELSEDDAKAKWNEMSVKDKLAFYENWEDRDENEDKKLSDLEFYQSFNIDAEDIPYCANPLTHDYDTNAKNRQVLMLHNEYSTTSSSASTPAYSKLGTAQKYTSSSTVTVVAGTSAKFSVWVKTSDLASTWTDGSEQEAVNKGAYISVTHSVGGKSMDPLLVKNINTELLNPNGDNHGWVQYEFYLHGSSYADSTFTIVLGLGLGGGTDRSEYVNGYAFFDDLTCEKITNDDYATQSTGATVLSVDDEKEINTTETATRKFALTFHKDFSAFNLLSQDFTTVNGGKVAQPTTEKKNGTTYTAANGVTGTSVYKGLGFATNNDVVDIFAKPADMKTAFETGGAYADNAYLQSVYNKYFASYNAEATGFKKTLADSPVLMLLSAEGAAYTANAPTMTNFTLQPDEYLAISFFVKTSDMKGVTGAGVILKDADTKSTLSNLDTTDIAKVDINDTVKDVYDGWQQCFLFVSNETDENQSFELSFTLGSTTVVGTTKANYESGFAAFANFEITKMTAKEFESAKSGSYAQVLSLKGQQEEETGDSGFDSAKVVPFDGLEKGYAQLKNYKGVYSDSAYVGGTETSINQNETAGLFSKEYLKLEDGTVENTAYATKLGEILGAGSYADNEARWNALFGADAQQPLVIYNAPDDKPETSSSPAYGFLGTTKSISADGYATVSLRVKVSQNAKAFIYLIDAEDDYKSTLSMSRRLTYFYDADGNICSADPTDSDFNDKKDVAFKLQANGLYKANPSWRNYGALSDADKNAYFANLSAYTETDADGNLLVAENGVSYDYNDNWRNEGNDGVAFYKGTDGYYADSAKKVLVKKLADITKADANDTTKPLLARYTAKTATEKEQFSFVVTNAEGEWATVTFYIQAGNETKNYRLEVWSGSRDGAETNPEGSYVIFDAYKPNEVTADNFSTLVDEKKEDLTEGVDYFESVFSFYDSASFLRYNPELDENEVGNSYEDYDSTTYTKGVAFLRFEDRANHAFEIYANYSLSETTVAADVEDTDTETDEDEEETNETNVWLLASSIAIAGVLLLAVVSLVVRKVVAKVRKKRGYSAVVKTDAPKKSKKAKKNDK